VYGSTTGDIVESDYGRDGPPDYCGEVLKPLGIHYWLSGICGGKVTAHSSVLSCVHSFSSAKETAQAAVHEWY
jgi:hypothetical protein